MQGIIGWATCNLCSYAIHTMHGVPCTYKNPNSACIPSYSPFLPLILHLLQFFKRPHSCKINSMWLAFFLFSPAPPPPPPLFILDVLILHLLQFFSVLILAKVIQCGNSCAWQQ
ncbi:hypothetical protein AAZV13_09G099850 [Glycine max]